ncbi:hypothetical protein FE257_011243 [Aspergillus nanangensis]|uniref:Cytochrome P450 n=1 Tax=Aspergillus nanangensis TaxID=2582783 RepID=A0AAD4GSP1_ASPNN|nr:hypothetical protein FE257_011243 [Aspergillus nanangensis]
MGTPILISTLFHLPGHWQDTFQLQPPLPWLPMVLVTLLFYLTFTACFPQTGNAAFRAPFVGSSYAWLARWDFFQSAASVIQNGHVQFKDKPWKLTGNDVIVLPHRYLNEIRRLPIHEASAMKANLDNMQSKFTHLDILNTTRLFVSILKTKVNPQLSILTSTIRRELDDAFAKELPSTLHDGEWVSVEAFETLHRIIGRISARIFGGKELRDDVNWLNTAEGYLNNIFTTAISIRLVPRGFKTLASWFLPCSWQISWNFWKAKRILLPYIRYRKSVLSQRADEIARTRREEFPDVLQYLIEAARGKDAEPMMGYKRKLSQNITLSDGLELPAGAHVEFAIVPIQQDNTNDSNVFNGLRYYQMRQSPAESYRHQFATTSEASLHFGHGQNSCPGRFMASNVIKMVLGTLLTEYEFKLDQEGRPEGIHAFEYNFPSPTARLMLKKRPVSTG